MDGIRKHRRRGELRVRSALSGLIACFAVCLTAACTRAPEPADSSAQATVFTAAAVIAGDGTVMERGGFLVENGTITRMAPVAELNAPANAAVVDLGDATILPLLVNLHGHPGLLDGMNLSAANYSRESILEHLRLYDRYGVGTVLALGSDVGNAAVTVREEQHRGTRDGARLFTAGRGITARGGWPTNIPALAEAPYQLSTADEARGAVRELAAARVDAVKIWVDDNLGRLPKLGPEAYRAAIEEAHAHDLPVYAHVFALEDAKELVRAGVDVLAHSVRDREVDAELIDLMKSRGVSYVATLTAHESTFVFAETPAWVDDPAFTAAYLDLPTALRRPEFVENVRKNPDLPKLREQYAIALKNLAALAHAGVRIGFGTDSGTANRFYGYNEHRELELMVSAGLTPLQAITAATETSAAILGLEDAGVLAPRRRADFLVVSGRPASDIRQTRAIKAVFRSGQALDAAGLASGTGR